MENLLKGIKTIKVQKSQDVKLFFFPFLTRFYNRFLKYRLVQSKTKWDLECSSANFVGF